MKKLLLILMMLALSLNMNLAHADNDDDFVNLCEHSYNGQVIREITITSVFSAYDTFGFSYSLSSVSGNNAQDHSITYHRDNKNSNNDNLALMFDTLQNAYNHNLLLDACIVNDGFIALEESREVR